MSGVVVVEFHRKNTFEEVIQLHDEVAKGDWREWMRQRLGRTDGDELCPIESAIPGVSILDSGGWLINVAATRIHYGGLHCSDPYDRSTLSGPVVVFAHRDDFGGRLTNLSIGQRVAIRLAAHGEWDAFNRALYSLRRSEVA